MWIIKESELFQRKIKQFIKNHPNEAKRCISNLQRFQNALHDGLTVYEASHLGFIHKEGNGILAISQNNRKLKETRLYIYPHEQTKTIHLLTIGDKQSQKKTDIPDCKELLDKLR